MKRLKVLVGIGLASVSLAVLPISAHAVTTATCNGSWGSFAISGSAESFGHCFSIGGSVTLTN